MPVVFDPGVFALGVAVGVLGLVLLLSLIIGYAYSERTLLVLAAYLVLVVAGLVAGPRVGLDPLWVQKALLVAGPTLMAGLQLYLLRNRQLNLLPKAVMVLSVTTGLGFLVLSAMPLWPPLAVYYASVAWLALLAALLVLMTVQSQDAAGPWRWWLMLGQATGLGVAACFLAGAATAPQSYWPVVLMLLLQTPPTYLSLVWRSRLLNESRLRSFSANVTDPLTGLATANVLVERIMRVTSRTAQANSGSALFLVEVQNWQGLINELGADFNEKMLLEAAMRLRRSIGDNDLAARIGGRFAVVAQGLSGDEDISALATRLVVSGLRIDSTLLNGVEFKFRVIVTHLESSRPMPLPEAHAWLAALADNFKRWPGSHRNRSILVVAARDVHAAQVPAPAPPRERHSSIKSA